MKLSDGVVLDSTDFEAFKTADEEKEVLALEGS